jgi:TolA-binding protein
MINQHHDSDKLLKVVLVFMLFQSLFLISTKVHAEELSQGQREFQKMLKSKNETPEDRIERPKETKKGKRVAQEMTQEQKIEELERKLNSVSKELQELKSQGLPEERLNSIEEKISVLAEEIDNIKSAAIVEEPTYEQVFGMGPAASKVYKANQGISIGGYGEIIGQIPGEGDGTLNALRAMLSVNTEVLRQGASLCGHFLTM